MWIRTKWRTFYINEYEYNDVSSTRELEQAGPGMENFAGDSNWNRRLKLDELILNSTSRYPLMLLFLCQKKGCFEACLGWFLKCFHGVFVWNVGGIFELVFLGLSGGNRGYSCDVLEWFFSCSWNWGVLGVVLQLVLAEFWGWSLYRFKARLVAHFEVFWGSFYRLFSADSLLSLVLLRLFFGNFLFSVILLCFCTCFAAFFSYKWWCFGWF